MRYVFIVNPTAGKGDNLLLFHEIHKSIVQAGHTAVLCLTEKSEDAKAIAASYSREPDGETVLVSCGGDGTLNEIVCGLAGDVPVMALPMGTGNDFCKTLYGKDMDLARVIKAFGLTDGNIRFDTRKVDYIEADGRRSINIMSFGFDTHVVLRGKKMKENHPKLAGAAYKLSILPTLMQDGFRYRVRACLQVLGEDGSVQETEEDLRYALMAFCNGRFYGGGVMPAPRACPDDGILEMCYVDEVSVPGALPIIPKYVSGQGDRHRKVHFRRVVGGRLQAVEGQTLLGNCDGEIFETKSVSFRIVPGGITVCVPVSQ